MATKNVASIGAGLASVGPNSNAKIEGVITVISPMKTGKTCTYYDGEISDNYSSPRFCGFNSTVRRRLEESYEKGESVVLQGCEIKKSRYRDGLEIIVKKGTDILKSEKSFEISKDNKAMVLLEKVQELPQYQRINVRVKVMHMEDVTESRSGEKVQEVIIADATEINGLMVKDYCGYKAFQQQRKCAQLRK